MSVRNVGGLICSVFVLAAIGVPVGNALSASPPPPQPFRSLQPQGLELDAAVVNVLDAQLEMGEMLERIEEFTPRFGEEVTEADVISAWTYLSSELAILGNELEIVGLDKDALVWIDDESFLVNDFSAFDYTQFYADECNALALLTDGQYSNPRAYLSEMRTAEDPAMLAQASGNVAISKILAFLGVSDLASAFDDILSRQAGPTLKAIGKAVQSKNISAIPKLVGRLGKTILSGKFGKALADKVGAKVAGKALATVGGKFIPVVGWAFLGGSVAWTFYEQYTESE